MGVEQYSLVANDWLNLEAIINDLTQRVVGQELHPSSEPTFGAGTITNNLNVGGDADITGDLGVGGTVTLDGLTASRIVATDASKELVSLASPLIVGEGGTGLATITDHGILLGSGTSAITPLGVAANGQIPIGSAGADPVLAEITGTANQITSTPGAGAITLSLPQDYDTAATPTLGGLTIVNAITEFSTDGTMAGDSDSAVPTEKATKFYTDTLRSDLASVANAKGASLVGVEDPLALYTATDVEAALEEVMDKVTPVTYTANSIATPTGTVDSGNVVSTQVINDADTYDVSEVTGSPGWDIRLTYTGITSGHEPNKIQLHVAYNGSAGHNVDFELWNYTGTPAFDKIATDAIVEAGGTFIFYEIDITGTITDYVSGGEAILRLNHTSSGNINHDVLVDFAALKDDTSGGSGITDHGALSGKLEDDHTQYLLADGTRALAGAWDMGSQALTNVNIDSGVITGITDLAVGDGGTGQSTAQAAIDALSAVSGATNEHVLTKDTGTGNAVFKAAGGIAAHAILDGSVHTDSVADAVTRGSVIYGNSTPKWDELVVGAANTFLGSDGTDLSYRTAAQTLASLSGAGAAAFDLNGQDLTNGGVLFLTEQAAAEANVAGKGQFFVKTATPNEPWFDNDAGTSIPLDNRYVERGTDPAGYDETQATLTMDNTWYDWDVGALGVPSNVRLVLVGVRVGDASTAVTLQLREKGNSNNIANRITRTQVANLSYDITHAVACDSNQIIEYKISAAGLDTAGLVVHGWWLNSQVA